MYQRHRQMTHTCLALRQWLSSLEGPPIPHQALLQAKTRFSEPSFFETVLYRVLSNLFECLIHLSHTL